MNLILGSHLGGPNVLKNGCCHALQSLSGLTSPVESVSFDSTEVMIGAGAANGTIKIWDIEEAKGVN
jgi:katanin p80 WD40 repeat-containing subunit B1